jgi:hypothetical protein
MAEPERLQRTDDATLMVLKDPRIQESSGLARSVRHQGVLYTHNDAGHDPVVFAVGSDGETRAALDLHRAPAADWEDIAVTGDGRVWVGDIGGNAKGRSTVSVVVFQEPKRLVDGAPDWVEYKLDYPDGRHNAEAILVNPETFRVYVVSKGPPGESMVYVAPRKLERTRPNRLEPLTPAPPSITAGSFAPDDSGRFALRNYRFAFIYDRWDEEPRQIELPRIPAGESLAMRADGDLLIGSEGPGSEVVQVPDTAKPSG